jgi:hypothetical protein
LASKHTEEIFLQKKDSFLLGFKFLVVALSLDIKYLIFKILLSQKEKWIKMLSLLSGVGELIEDTAFSVTLCQVSEV